MRIRPCTFVAAFALSVVVAARSEAQSTLADTLGVLDAAARGVQPDPAGRLFFAAGIGWESDTLRAAVLLERLGLPAPGRDGNPSYFRCAWSRSGATGAQTGYRVRMDPPTFAGADSANVVVSLGCAVEGPRSYGFARDDLYVLRRMPGGAWRVVARVLRRIT